MPKKITQKNRKPAGLQLIVNNYFLGLNKPCQKTKQERFER